MNWLKVAGVADGVLLAGVTALGQLMPSWAQYTQTAVEVLGALGTVLGTIHAVGASAKKSSEPMFPKG